jgi:hypothetical protein
VEHVLSEAFGKFEEPLKLRYCVCQDCNQYFGDQLELRFARGAFEGMLRYQKSVRQPPRGKIHLPYVEFAVPDGEWAGVRLALMNGGDGLQFILIPQAAFFDESQKRWVYVTIGKIEKGILTTRPDCFLKKGVQIRIFAPAPQEHETIISKLNEHSVNYQRSGALHATEIAFGTPEPVIEATFTVNHCCPVRSPIDSTGCRGRVSRCRSRRPEVPVKWAFSRRA